MCTAAVVASILITAVLSAQDLIEYQNIGDSFKIIPMTTTSGPQQRYDHRLRDLIQRTGDLGGGNFYRITFP